MGLRTETRTIGGHTYQITVFPARQGLRLQTRLLKVLGPSVGELLGAVTGSGNGAAKGLRSLSLDTEIPAEALRAFVRELAGRLDEHEVEGLILHLFGQTLRDGQPVGEEGAFDLAYTDNFAELWKAVYAVLEVNFRSFFGGTGAPPSPAPGGTETGAYRES